MPTLTPTLEGITRKVREILAYPNPERLKNAIARIKIAYPDWTFDPEHPETSLIQGMVTLTAQPQGVARTVAIEEHPAFAALREKYEWGEEKEAFPAMLSNGTPNPFFGVIGFICI